MLPVLLLFLKDESRSVVILSAIEVYTHIHLHIHSLPTHSLPEKPPARNVVHFFPQNLKNRKEREKLERFVALGNVTVDFDAARLHSPPHTLRIRVGIIERIN